ncbi:MAG: hypothetical protein J5687_08680 [Treponema sp.]|nr:hypothetical protein [Treponema sp.]
MENEIEKKEYAEDEISLLDLFAVLVRYRKLIVLGTGIVTLLTILWLFILPLFAKKSSVQNAKVTYTVRVKSIPISISERLPNSKEITPIYLATYSTQRLPFLVEKIKENNVFSDTNDMTDYEFNAYVQGLIKEKTIEIESSPLGTEYSIILKIPINSIGDGTKLVNSIISDADKEIQNYYIPLIKTLQQNTEVSIQKAMSLQTGASDISSLQSLQEFATDLQEFIGSFDGFLSLRGEPFVVPEGRGRVKKTVIIFLAAFFVFVFIAFLKNAIENIKADPVSSKLIADAWKAGK